MAPRGILKIEMGSVGGLGLSLLVVSRARGGLEEEILAS